MQKEKASEKPADLIDVESIYLTVGFPAYVIPGSLGAGELLLR